MTSEKPQSKKAKFIDTWFSKANVESLVSNVVSKPSVSSLPVPAIINVQSVPLVPSLKLNKTESPDYLNAFERDPRKRCAIWKYPVNEQDHVRRTYVSLGPCQPKISYPLSQHGDQQRRFKASWFKDYSWLEYSVDLDSAYCFPCFLFDTQDSPHTLFARVGFKSWKRVSCLRDNAFVRHVGCIQSPHNVAMQKWDNLMNPTKQIETVFLSKSTKDVEDNRLRLKATIESVRLLANQGAPFRGHDESEDSLNAGYFKEVVNSFARMSEEVDRVVKDAPRNAKYISPKIQKEILSILSNKVRNKIREEVRDSKYCILVDEAVDISSKEQMAIILRFVDGQGFLRERFFKIVSVPNTSSQTLKNEISKVLTMYDLQVMNMRGQGYDGASNMSSIYNGLQALFLEEYPYAYYVHCFAHRLQLTLNATAKGVHDIWQFFSTLNLIVNFVDSSAKRHSALKELRKEEIANLVACGSNHQSGSGLNQMHSLQRPCATRWSSHYRSINSLIELFSSTNKTLCDMIVQASPELQGEAKGVIKALRSFDFVFCLLLMHKVMKITEVLCQALQKKSIDFVHAMQLVGNTKTLLQEFRTNGWPKLLSHVESFCIQHDIDMPDMGARYKNGTGRRCQQKDIITVEHHYRFDILYALVDLQLSELGRRFSDQTSELLILSSTLDPHDNFKNFTCDDVCSLAKKFYPEDFIDDDMYALEGECPFYEINIRNDPKFNNLESISDLCRVLAQTRKSITLFPMIYRLICLVMTLPVSTATTERAFSAMNIIKNKLRNKMEDEFLGDCMVLYIEKEYAESIDNDQVIKYFESLGNRRVKFS